MGKNDYCAIGKCNNSRRYKDKQVIKPHISNYNGSMEIKFWKCREEVNRIRWTNACGRKHFKFGENNVICSNHFEMGRPTPAFPNPTLFLKGYEDEPVAKKESHQKLG